MNKRIIAALVAIFTTLSPSTLYAEESRIMRFEINETTFTIDGAIQEGADARLKIQERGINMPIYIDSVHNRAMMPLWMAIKAFDTLFDIHRDNVWIMGSVLVSLTLNDPRPDGMGAARVYEDTGAWFVPLRYVAETFGHEVIWDDAAQAVYIMPLTFNTTTEERVLRFEIGNDVYTIDDVVRKGNTGWGYFDFDYERADVIAPVYIDPMHNRTMVPVYMIREALDARMWFDCNSYVTFFRDGVYVTLRLGNSLPESMGMATVQHGTWVWFAPLRYVAETFGHEVIWDDAAQAVYIIKR